MMEAFLSLAIRKHTVYYQNLSGARKAMEQKLPDPLGTESLRARVAFSMFDLNTKIILFYYFTHFFYWKKKKLAAY